MTSSASSRDSGGRIPGSRRASIDFPIPGRPGEQEVVSARRRRARVRDGHAPVHARRRGREPRQAEHRRSKRPRPASARTRPAGSRRPRRDGVPAPARSRRAPPRPPTRPRRAVARARPARALGCGEDSGNRAQASVERELSDRRVSREPVRRELAGGRENRERDREVEARALLPQAGGREVDGDPARRPLELGATRSRCGPDASPPGRRGRRGPTIASPGTPFWRCASTSTLRASSPTSACVTVAREHRPTLGGEVARVCADWCRKARSASDAHR